VIGQCLGSGNKLSTLIVYHFLDDLEDDSEGEVEGAVELEHELEIEE
jgi:hypothetical protein